MIIAPTEPPALREIADAVNMYPERHGCDILLIARGQKIGIQRKEIKDLFGSVEDGRLKMQMDQMSNLHAAYVIIEGAPRFTNTGELMGRRYGRRWNRDGYTGILISIANRGVKVLHSKDLTDTIRLCEYLDQWHNKDSHALIDGARLGPTKMWGVAPTHKEFACHMLEGIPGVGGKMSRAIYDMYGLPLHVTLDEKELQRVPGVGPKMAKKIVRAINGDMKPTEFVK